jgi:hypothetical protein
MSGIQVVGLIIAVFLVLGACVMALVLMRVTELLLTLKGTLTALTTATLPLLEEAEQAATTGNASMAKVAAITENLQAVTDNVGAVTATASAAAGSPVIKTASFSYGVRRVIASRTSPDRAKQVRTELAADRREQREQRARRRGSSPADEGR